MRAVILAVLLTLPASGDGVYTYRLRGEVRLLLLWLGKDDVGGGRVTIARGKPASSQWREEIEVLFGSNPDRIPKGINRWGYGREISDWAAGSSGGSPKLTASEFQGIMRHSPEASVDEALEATREAKATQQFLYDITVSKVLPARSTSEFRVLAENQDFDYRSPDGLLSDYRRHIATTPALRGNHLSNEPAAYVQPYGFLTGVDELISRSLSSGSPSTLTFVYNARPYQLDLTSVRPVGASKIRPEWKAGGVREVLQLRFRCLNKVKRTRTDFELWIPRAGDFRGVPVRILLQPRWWLRLQMDLAPPVRTAATAP